VAVPLRKRPQRIVEANEDGVPSEVLRPTYLIECKQSKLEWVIFLPTAGLSGGTDLYPDSCFSPLGFGQDLVDFVRLSMGASPRAVEVASLLDSLPFTPPGRIGHGIAALSDAPNRDQGKNRAYAAVEGCVQAVEFFERKQVEYMRSPAYRSGSHLSLAVSIHMPLVVLEGQLFTVEVDTSGHQVFQPVSSAAVYFRGAGRHQGIVVPVVTTPDLQEFAESSLMSWLQIGEFAASAGALPGEEKSMLRLTLEQRGLSGPEDPEDVSGESPPEEPSQ